MSNELTVVEAVDSLEKYSAEDLRKIEALHQKMTVVPEGLAVGVNWREATVKIHMGRKNPMMPSDAREGDLWVPGHTVWKADEDGSNNPLQCILLFAKKERVRFSPGDNRPTCSSRDLEYNDAGTIKCDECPHFPWRNGQRQECNEQIIAYLLPLSLDDVYKVYFSKTSTGAGKNMANVVARSGIPQSEIVFGLRSSPMSNNSYSWHVFDTVHLANVEVPEYVSEFAKFLTHKYATNHEKMLKELAARREAMSEGLSAMEGLADDSDIIDVGEDESFEDVM